MKTKNEIIEVTQLNPQQIRVISLLLDGQTQGNAAETIGIAPETISRWKQDPFFLAALNGAKLAGYETAEAGLRALANHALDTLAELLEDAETIPPAIRLAAAKTILSFVMTLGKPTGSTDPKRIEKDMMREAMFHSYF